jgi:CBS domain-containing protein
MVERDDAGRQSPFATQPLRAEYAALEPVLSGVTTLADRVRGRHLVHPLLLVGGLTCLDTFQRCHDRKIETALLPALKARDTSLEIEAANELARQHEQARRRLAALRDVVAGSQGLSAAACRLAEECVAALRAHAAHEFEGVFHVADRMLSTEEVAPLWEAFRQIDEREIRPGEARALRALADAIDPTRDPTADAIAYVGGVVAAHVMRPRPRSVRPGDTLSRASELMDRTSVRELPVVRDGRLCGIVSRTDLQAHLGHLEWTGVEAVMTRDPVAVTPEQSAASVSQVLLRGRFNAVPVIADDATLVGMVSRSDLLRAVADHAPAH